MGLLVVYGPLNFILTGQLPGFFNAFSPRQEGGAGRRSGGSRTWGSGTTRGGSGNHGGGNHGNAEGWTDYINPGYWYNKWFSWTDGNTQRQQEPHPDQK